MLFRSPPLLPPPVLRRQLRRSTPVASATQADVPDSSFTALCVAPSTVGRLCVVAGYESVGITGRVGGPWDGGSEGKASGGGGESTRLIARWSVVRMPQE